MGRPEIPIDPDQVSKLAQLGCKVSEIADFFGVSRDTIERRFREEIVEGRAKLRVSLRRLQIEKAMEGNVVMLIWLGKQELGQVDSVAHLSDFEAKRAQAMSDDELKKATLRLVKKDTG